LSENAAFAEACEAAGLAFVGPTPAQLRTFGLKHTARALAKAQGVPLLEGPVCWPIALKRAGRRTPSAIR
jgi:urea carboxylase